MKFLKYLRSSHSKLANNLSDVEPLGCALKSHLLLLRCANLRKAEIHSIQRIHNLYGPTWLFFSSNKGVIFNAFERTNAYECVSGTERVTAHGDVVVNRASSIECADVVNRASSIERADVVNRVSSLERADCALAAQAPVDDEEFYREKILYSQARQLYPLQEDLADWINKTIGKCVYL